MSKNTQSYELLQYGREQEADTDEKRSLNVESTAYDSHRVVDNDTTALIQGPDAEETPNVALERKFRALILSLLGHVIPAILTVAIVLLSVFQVYWFDMDASADASENISWKHRGIGISWNELQNLLQFVAKIHEILLCGSLGAMVLHRVRVRLLSKHGLPFGMLAGGYAVGSPEYLLSSAFRSGLNRQFWLLSLLIFAFTLLANTIGPASAIALLPTLDWWQMKNPFGNEALPTVFDLPKDQWWPLELTKDYTAILALDDEDYCFSGGAFTIKECPASGWNELLTWSTANALGAIDANVTLGDGYSPVQRRIKSRLSERHDTTPGVAITTTLSQTMASVMGTFWEQVKSRDFPVNDVLRPQLELADGQTSLQPLVQVQCSPISLADLRTLKDSTIKTNDDVNTFSTKDAPELPIPDWARDLDYNPPNKMLADAGGKSIIPFEQSVNVTWLWPDSNDFNLSLAAVITTPFLAGDLDNWFDTNQTAYVHFCSVDARWIGSQPSHDPSEHLVLNNNVTDPLVFQKREGGSDNSYRDDVAKWGVSPALKLSKDWANSLNIPSEVDNITASTFQWLLGSYVEYSNTTDEDDILLKYLFNPGVNGIHYAKVSFENFDVNDYAMSASETVATVLGLQLTDALARVRLSEVLSGFLVTGQVNATHDSISWLAGSIAGIDAQGDANVPAKDIEAMPTKILFQVERFGYGYGFKSATVWFGVMILLAHTLLTIIYMIYAIIDFFWVSKWTSSAWGDIGEFAALLINSKTTIELQNTCAGIDSKNTWQKRVRIRETGERHLGIVVGESYKMYPPVKKGVEYGTLDVKNGGSGLRKRRCSV